MAKYFIFAALIVAGFVFLPFLVLEIPETATTRGLLMVGAEYAGTGIAALLLGALGLLYKANRFSGFVVGTFVAIGLLAYGARAETICKLIGQSVRLCDVPAMWQEVQPQAHAEAEYRGSDGFFAQVILDSAGSNQGLTLATAADFVVANMQNTVGADNFNLLMRGTNSDIRDSEIVVYQATIEGIPFVYANTIYVGQNETIQLVTWRIASELDVSDRSAHLDFGLGLVLMPSF